MVNNLNHVVMNVIISHVTILKFHKTNNTVLIAGIVSLHTITY